MSEETQIPEFPEYTGFELLDIISNQLEVIATLAELTAGFFILVAKPCHRYGWTR